MSQDRREALFGAKEQRGSVFKTLFGCGDALNPFYVGWVSLYSPSVAVALVLGVHYDKHYISHGCGEGNAALE